LYNVIAYDVTYVLTNRPICDSCQFLTWPIYFSRISLGLHISNVNEQAKGIKWTYFNPYKLDENSP